MLDAGRNFAMINFYVSADMFLMSPFPHDLLVSFGPYIICREIFEIAGPLVQRSTIFMPFSSP